MNNDTQPFKQDINLQSAPDTLVDAFKAKMSGGFEENVVKLGDSNYKYDTREKFNPGEKSGWDSDSDGDTF